MHLRLGDGECGAAAARRALSAVRIAADAATELARRIFVVYGAPDRDARIVSEHLVTCDLMGVHSHGLNRVVQYTGEIASGLLQPAAVPAVRRLGPTCLLIDGGSGFGQVACTAAVEVAAEAVAAHGTAFVAVRNTQHTGRLGAYTEALARAGNVAMAFGSGAPRFHRVPPFGGLEGRMSTNPISWAAPTATEPLVADFATTSVPEGKIRLWRDTRREVPRDALCDAAGRMSFDPEDLYADPPGFLLPLGGERYGHKGSALAMLAEMVATVLAGDAIGDTESRGQNLALLAIRGPEDLADRVSDTVRYLRSSAPRDPARPVLMPGEIEQNAAAGATSVELGQASWQRLEAVAVDAGVPTPPVGSA